MSQRPGSFVNTAGILASDSPADVVRKLDAAWEAASTPAAPGIDLEQFREAVLAQHAALMSSWCGDPETKAAADQRRDRLLALIGASPKGGSDAQAGMHSTELAALLWRELSNNGFLIGGPDFESVAHPVDKARFIAIAEIVQDAMQATSAEVDR